MNRNFLIFILVAFLFTINTKAHNNRQRNIVYVLDCTRSMNGYDGAPDIWDATKTYLKTELNKAIKENPNVKITILPFQDKSLTPIIINPQKLDWDKHEANLNSYIKKITFTNICDAWLTAEGYIDESCENYVILMTDGHDNIGGKSNKEVRMQQLSEIFNKFCNKYANTKGVYVELTHQATLPEIIKNAIDVCKDLYIVDATEGIPSFGCISDNIININTRDLPIDINLGFSNSGKFSAIISNIDNECLNISIKDGIIDKGIMSLHIESKFGDNIKALNDIVDSENGTVTFNIQSDEVIIVNPEIQLDISTAPIRTLDINEQIKTSFAERTQPFLFIKGNKTDTISWDLSLKFNDEAVKDKASVYYNIKVDTIAQNCILLFDGMEFSPKEELIVNTDNRGLLQLVVPQEMKDAKIKISLNQIYSKDIDRINDVRPDNTTIVLNGEITTIISIVEKIVWGILALLILAIIIWFVFLKKRIYPKFKKGKIIIQSPYFATIKVAGARKVEITSSKKKQSWIDKLWRGKVVYHTTADWVCAAQITPSGKNMRFKCQSDIVYCEPANLWSSGNNYTIKNATQNNSDIKITIN